MTALTPTEREQILERTIGRYTDQGWVLKKRTTTDATLVPGHRKKKLTADGCLTLVTFGLWAIPATISAAAGEHKKVTIHINTDGSVLIHGPHI